MKQYTFIAVVHGCQKTNGVLSTRTAKHLTEVSVKLTHPLPKLGASYNVRVMLEKNQNTGSNEAHIIEFTDRQPNVISTSRVEMTCTVISIKGNIAHAVTENCDDVTLKFIADGEFEQESVNEGDDLMVIGHFGSNCSIIADYYMSSHNAWFGIPEREEL